MTARSHILIVDDDPDIQTAGRLLLQQHFDQVFCLGDPTRIPATIEEHRPQVILLDMNFGPGESSGREGLEWLARIRAAHPDISIIVITAHGGVKTAVEAMKQGANDFVAKPWQNEKLVATVQAALELNRSKSETQKLQRQKRALAHASTGQPDFIGDSPAMRDLFSLIERAAPTDANVLVLGENGTGKELAARAIHAKSRRSDQVFMSVDLGAVTESLFEPELFGHKKGAFTGAQADRAGRFLAADGGTIFLDEVGNLPLHLQAKLLTVLEQRQVTAVGSDTPQPVDVRIIAATNQPLDVLRDESRFRQDLLFRLNTVEIAMPALRDRGQDIITLARHYLDRFEKKYDRPHKDMASDLPTQLLADAWPGNVRALRHAAERAVILSNGDSYDAADFSLSQGPGPGHQLMEPTVSDAPAIPDSLHLETLERKAIQQALSRHRYNISHAAKELGLTRAALYRRMDKHGL